MTYGEAGETLGIDANDFHTFAASNAAFVLKRKNSAGTSILLLKSDETNPRRERFSMAHELGHIVLGHDKDDEISEREANIFASVFLCPRPILRTIGSRSISEVSSAFKVSLTAASIAISRMYIPDRANKDICEELKRHFKTETRSKIDDYINLGYLADFYAARLPREKSPRITAGRASPYLSTDDSLDDMERLMETRIDGCAF